MHKEILITVDEFETRVAVLEERRLVEYYAEESDQLRLAGNIYLGEVKDILPGMEASFVNCGLERNAFLFVKEVVVDGGEAGSVRIENLLKPGQAIIVQVRKEPVDRKGSRVTAQIALPGRNVVLMPKNTFIGVSKKIDGDERDRVEGLARKVCPPGMGLIVRTVADHAGEEELARDVELLKARWDAIEERALKSKAPSLLHKELNLIGRILRDVFSVEYDTMTIEGGSLEDEILDEIRTTTPELTDRVRRYHGKLPLFQKHDVQGQLKSALKRRVWLRSGGYIAIDRTEALTGIDVNTAKYTGGRNLEQTTYKTNLEAVSEIARQLRLRDIGGIIVIDFIDMQEPVHREALFDAFSVALEHDRAKSRVIEISRLGLLEMTRKSISEGVKSHFYMDCPLCGEGKVLSRRRAGIEAYRKIKREAIAHASRAFVFNVAPDVARTIKEENWADMLFKATEKKVYIVGAESYDSDEVAVVREGTVAQIEKYMHGAGVSV